MLSESYETAVHLGPTTSQPSFWSVLLDQHPKVYISLSTSGDLVTSQPTGKTASLLHCTKAKDLGQNARITDRLRFCLSRTVFAHVLLARIQPLLETPLGDADLDDHVAGGLTRSGGTRGQTPADHWRQAQRRGHRRGEGTLRPTMATRWWWSIFTSDVNTSLFISEFHDYRQRYGRIWLCDLEFLLLFLPLLVHLKCSTLLSVPGLVCISFHSKVTAHFARRWYDLELTSKLQGESNPFNFCSFSNACKFSNGVLRYC